MRNSSSLRFRLQLLVFFALLPAFVLTILGTVERRRLAAVSAQEQALLLTHVAVSNHGALFEGARQLLTTLAHLPMVYNANSVQCNKLMAELVDLHPPYINIGVIALDGTLICSGLPITGIVNLSDRGYFRDALAGKSFSVGDYQIGRVTGKPSINFGYPVIDEAGSIRGVVYIALGLEWLGSLFDQADLPPDSVLTVIDSKGTILARHPFFEGFVGHTFADVPVIQAVLSKKEGTTESVGVDGIRRLYAFSPLGHSNSDTFVNIGTPTSVAFAQVDRIATRNIAFISLAIVLAMLSAWISSNYLILRPANAFMKSIERLSSGDFSVRSETKSKVGELQQLAQSFNQMAVALESREHERQSAVDALHHSEQEIRQTAARTEALLQAAARLNAQLDMQTVLETVCQVVEQALGVASITISLYDERQDHFVHRFDRGLPADYRKRVRPVSRQTVEQLVEETAAVRGTTNEEQLIIRPDIQQLPNDPNAQALTDFDIRTVVSIGMARGEQPIGRFTLLVQHTPREFTETELALLTGLANQASQAIANARLFEHATLQLRRLQTLNTIDHIIISGLSLPETLTQISEQIIAQLDVDAVAILLLNSQSNLLEYAGGQGFRTEAIHRRVLDVGESYAGRAVQSREYVRVLDMLLEDDPSQSLLIQGEDFRAYCCTPLIARDEIIGVVEVFSRAVLVPDPERVAFLKPMAMQTAIAITNVQLYAETWHLLEQAQEQARYVQQIIDTVATGMVLLDAENRILLANPAAQAYLPLFARLTTDNVLYNLNGRTLSEYLETTPPRAWNDVDISDDEREFQLATYPLDIGPQAGGWVLAVRDVTEERKHQEYMHTQERMATVGQMAAGIAHDFNNIMGAIVLYSQLLRSKAKLTERENQYLITIDKQAKHATNLIHQILDFSRRSVMQRSPMNLLPFVKELVKLLERTLPENVQLVLEAEEEAYLVSVDPTRLQQALMNLAINASHAMPDGGDLSFSLSHFTLQAKDKPPLPDMQIGEWVAIAVADSGVGIAAEVQAHIFEPFFTTKGPGKGTGLGLSQVYGIVQQHDGRITVSSTVGKGTTFVIFLPSLAQQPPTTLALVSPEVSLGDNETILLVEDNESVREAICSILSELGYHVLCAADGQAAIEIYQAQTSAIDLVLSDLIMPRLGGIELCHALQQQNANIKIIIMSGYPLGDDKRTLLERGVIDWVQKPFDQNQISNKVRAALHG